MFADKTMFAEINIHGFMVSSGLLKFSGYMDYVLGYLFSRFKDHEDGHEIRQIDPLHNQ